MSLARLILIRWSASKALQALQGVKDLKTGYRWQAALACLAFSGLLLAGCPPNGSTKPGYVGTSTCLGCHNGQDAPDQRGYTDSVHFAEGVTCEDCHGPGALHVQFIGRGGELLIENPREGGFENSYKSCNACHSDEVEQFLLSGHAEDQVATCYDCHSLHTKDLWKLPFEDNRVCLQCHGKTDFPDDDAIVAHTFHENMPAERASLCVGCHMQPLSRTDQNKGDDFNHTLIPAQPKISADAINAGEQAPANTCAGVIGCHDGSNEEAPFFDVDDLDTNLRLQRIYEDRYGTGEGETEGEPGGTQSIHTAALVRLIQGQQP